MTEVNHFAYGWANPALAYVMSALGCLLAIMLTTKARGRRGRTRIRLLVYATVALGGVAIFQAYLVAMLGLAVPATVVRFEPVPLLASLGLALAVVGSGLVIVVFRAPTTARLGLAGLVVGVGLAAAQYVAATAISVGGTVGYEPVRLVGSVGIALLVGCGVLWCTVTLAGLRPAVIAGAGLGLALCVAHYLGLSALTVRLGPAPAGMQTVPGLSPVLLVAPVILVGAMLTAMLWFFTVGTSTVDDLNTIFATPEHSVEIEPWMIEEVTTRISLGYGPPRSLSNPLAPTAFKRGVAANPKPVPSQDWRAVPDWGNVASNNTVRNANATVAAHKNAPARLPSRYPPAATQTHR
jgi:NO-binding membrane sensor protein with MHYT domain